MWEEDLKRTAASWDHNRELDKVANKCCRRQVNYERDALTQHRMNMGEYMEEDRDEADRQEYERLMKKFGTQVRLTTAFIEEEEDDFGYTTAVDLPEFDWPLRRKPFAGAGDDKLPPLDNLDINDNAGGMDDQQPPTQTHITTPPPIKPTREPVKPEQVHMTFDDDEYPSRPMFPLFRTKVGIYAEALAKLRYWDDE
ncbi:hypothetical protein WOLCODRAFT_156884 [Wolfiporia cocos MD-104 SS10]|uniref:Uncharacterized protein n=1 Tax=Wolfiporia cocos (strain MD-104) TaxID=742152 RepID=A0A2H3J1U7_WOLCO|nr:hypothetical protein WOLCODRAFT_156884 [Wolfiporia cocos MD-104 SS10]